MADYVWTRQVGAVRVAVIAEGWGHWPLERGLADVPEDAWRPVVEADHEKCIRRDLCVCPAVVWTQMQVDISTWRHAVTGEPGADARSFFEERTRKRCPLGRNTTPEDIGWAVAFLASDRARNITGQALHVDGGAVMR